MLTRFLALVAMAAAVPQGALAADAAAGEAIFKARCMACHVIGAGQKGLLAPNLRGVVGRKAASTEFAYSPALKASGLAWSKGNLDKFLTAPMTMVPGTRMVVNISDAQERADVIAWLATLK